jgi:hypothetical protein
MWTILAWILLSLLLIVWACLLLTMLQMVWAGRQRVRRDATAMLDGLADRRRLELQRCRDCSAPSWSGICDGCLEQRRAL